MKTLLNLNHRLRRKTSLFFLITIITLSSACDSSNISDAGDDLSINGIIAPGEYLSLTHNLDRNDLLFSAQFIKDGYIYNFSEYADFFGDKCDIRENLCIFKNGNTTYLSTTKLNNGNVLIAYNDGTFSVYNQDGFPVLSPVIFEYNGTSHVSAVSLADGNVFIAYTNVGNSGYGTFVIYSSTGTLVKGPTIFESAYTNNISVSQLTSGNIFIAYDDAGNTHRSTFVIYSSEGVLVAGPTVIENDTNVDSHSIAALADGYAFMAYTSGSNGYYSIYSGNGTLTHGPIAFNGFPASSLPNGNVLLTYRDNSNYCATFLILDNTGSTVSGPTVFSNEYAGLYSTTTLPNGNLLVLYKKTTGYLAYVIVSPAGALICEEKKIDMQHTSAHSVSPFPDGSVLIAYIDTENSNKGTFFTMYPGKNRLELERVNSNEVRLWNNTKEELECVLSVEQ